MKFTIGKFDPATSTVPVSFVHNDFTHKRPVNAVSKEDGSYDAAATRARVEDVARGVEQKIDMGLLTPPKEAPAPEADEAPAKPA